MKEYKAKKKPGNSDSCGFTSSGKSNMASKKNDPQGSYTGVPVDPYEKPVQDADDL